MQAKGAITALAITVVLGAGIAISRARRAQPLPVSDALQPPQAPEEECFRSDGREVHCADAVGWLERNGVPAGHSVITSIPDITEAIDGVADGTNNNGTMGVAAYKVWFVKVAALILRALPPGQFAIFYQSDVKIMDPRDGSRCLEWVDKAALCAAAAAATPDCTLLWHKICTLDEVERHSQRDTRGKTLVERHSWGDTRGNTLVERRRL